MRFSDVLIRSHDELAKTNNHIRYVLSQEAHSAEKGTYPLVYQYLGTRNNRRTTHEIQEDSIIGEMTNIHQNDDSGDILCDVIIHDVKQNSSNFNFKIDNIVVCIKDGKDTIVNGVVYNPYAKSVIDERRKQFNSSGQVVKNEASPIPDVVAEDKVLNPLFIPEVRESINESLEGDLKGGVLSDE